MLRNIADFETICEKIQMRYDQNKKNIPRYNTDLPESARTKSLGWIVLVLDQFKKYDFLKKFQKIKTFKKCSEISSNKKTKRKKILGMGCIFQNLLELAFFIE